MHKMSLLYSWCAMCVGQQVKPECSFLSIHIIIIAYYGCEFYCSARAKGSLAPVKIDAFGNGRTKKNITHDQNTSRRLPFVGANNTVFSAFTIDHTPT